jgi:PiT family inorganic phosphate transporter
MDARALVVFIIFVALVFDFINGFHDAANSIATVVSTRVLTPTQAVVWAAFFNFVAAFGFGVSVARTIGKGIVKPEVIGLATVAAAMVAIIFWSTLAWWYGLPTSESHALIAGLSGAGLATAGPGVLLWEGWQKVLLGLGISTFFGFLGGIGLMALIYRLAARARTPTELFTLAAQPVTPAPPGSDGSGLSGRGWQQDAGDQAEHRGHEGQANQRGQQTDPEVARIAR